MSDTQRAELEEELHFLSSLIGCAGWNYFKAQVGEQAKGLVEQLGPPACVEDFTMLGMMSHVERIVAAFPSQLEARRENLVAILEDMTGDEDA